MLPHIHMREPHLAMKACLIQSTRSSLKNSNSSFQTRSMLSSPSHRHPKASMLRTLWEREKKERKEKRGQLFFKREKMQCLIKRGEKERGVTFPVTQDQHGLYMNIKTLTISCPHFLSTISTIYRYIDI